METETKSQTGGFIVSAFEEGFNSFYSSDQAGSKLKTKKPRQHPPPDQQFPEVHERSTLQQIFIDRHGFTEEPFDSIPFIIKALIVP